MKWNKKSLIKMNRIFRENMKIIVLLSSIVLVSAASVEPPPRSVNVALETSFLFEPKDIKDNISVINNIKAFLDKLYRVLATNDKPPPPVEMKPARTGDERRVNSFFDIIQEFGQNFMNYTGEKLQEAVKVMHVEVNKIVDKTKSTYKDVVPDRQLKSNVEGSRHWKRTDAKKLQENYRRVMNEHKPIIMSFARKMNDYYSEDDVNKLFHILRKFDICLENKMDATKVVQELFHFGILNKYRNLNQTSRDNLLNDLKELSKTIMKNKKLKSEHNLSSNRKEFVDDSTIEATTEDRFNVSEDKTESNSHELLNELESIIEKALKRSAKNKKGVNNEVVVDNVELIVQVLKKPER